MMPNHNLNTYKDWGHFGGTIHPLTTNLVPLIRCTKQSRVSIPVTIAMDSYW